MKGYTIQHSIDLLEKAVENGGGSGEASTAADVSYDNTSSHLTADDVQEAIDELKASIDDIDISDLDTKIGNVETALSYPTDDTPIVVGKYGERDILRKRIYLATLTSGENAIGSQLPKFDVLIGWRGYVKTSESSPRFMAVNTDLDSNFRNAVLTYATYVPATGSINVGTQFNGGSAEIWIDYVAPVETPANNTRSKNHLNRRN